MKAAAWTGTLIVPVVLLGMLLTAPLVVTAPPAAASCFTGASVVVAGGSREPAVIAAQLPADLSVAGWSGEQLLNAAVIVNAGADLGVPDRGQAIAVMTAMGESSLLVLDRGDAVGPDSRGLFQQRANGAWGSYADRMDPWISSQNFYRALLEVDGWENLAPTEAAHRVQRNADPNHYSRWWNDAVQVVETLTGGDVAGVAAGTGTALCTALSPGEVSADGWTRPATGPITSQFGNRLHPVLQTWRLHGGTDFGGGCDAPIYAAAAGTVVRAGPASGWGNVIVVDHGIDPLTGGRITTYSAHMETDGIFTRVNDTVDAGRQIAEIGTAGMSTGCHLHFEVRVDGTRVDPVPFLRARGVAL